MLPARLSKARFSLRVSIFNWDHPPRLAELLDYLANNPGTVDEVALFTQISGSALPLGTIQEHARRLKQVLPRFKALGLPAGINHLATVGHYDENLAHSLDEPWQRLVDISGEVSRGCYCASDSRVQEYIRQVYIALAETEPDFIWFDDDLRLEPHGSRVQYPCFCDACLAIFAQETGQSWTREALRKAFGGDWRHELAVEGEIATPSALAMTGEIAGQSALAMTGERELSERLELRRRWLEHNRQYAARALAVMRAAVDEVNPELPLGFMTVEGSYSAYGMAEWAQALAGKKNLPVKCRPGGGYYTDRIPVESLAKAHWTGRQNAFLPSKVVDVQYEHENFPYQPPMKSQAVFRDEIAMALAVGCTGAAFNIMGLTRDPLGEFFPYLDEVRACRPFFDRLAATFQRSPNLGFWPGFTRDHSAALNPRQDWFATPLWGVDFSLFTELAEIGLPMAYEPQAAALAALNRTSVLDLPRTELLRLLAGGVMLDGPALVELEGMGLGEYTGFSVLGIKEEDTFETFSDDPLNGAYAGWQRDCHPSFHPDKAHRLAPHPGARVLAELTDFEQVSQGPCAGVFENRLGGRVAVLGYYPWILLQSLAKSSQIKALFRWLSRARLPGYIASHARAALWCKADPAGRLAFLVINASLDPAPGLELLALTGGTELTWLRMHGREGALQAAGVDGSYYRYRLPELKPWEAVLLAQQPG